MSLTTYTIEFLSSNGGRILERVEIQTASRDEAVLTARNNAKNRKDESGRPFQFRVRLAGK